MDQIIIICIAALITSLLTFFTGFGLGTILTPVFAIFFPVEIAIALTGIVHFFNNLFKLALVGRKADKVVILRFGLPAFFAALLGAFLLLQITDWKPLHTYAIGSREFTITPVKLVVAVLLIFFALMEATPRIRNFQFGNDKLIIGGILSGFFGGLSGNQGALRSAFLIKSGLSKESFIATGVVIACIVDFSRLGIYMTRFSRSGLQDNLPLVVAATLSAFAGAFLGSKMLKKVTLSTVQTLVTVLLVALSLALGVGLI